MNFRKLKQPAIFNGGFIYKAGLTYIVDDIILTAII
jgi:hypothetical protein